MPDLKFSNSLHTNSEKKAVDETIELHGPVTLEITERLVYSGWQRTQERRHLLLPTLHALQRASGWISPGGLDYACRVLEVPPAEAYSVVTLYQLFSSQPRGELTARRIATLVLIPTGCGVPPVLISHWV